MSENSNIEWTDHTHNIVWGCEKISPACKFCYAEGIATWRGHDVWGADKPRRILSDAYWRNPLKWDRDAKAAGKIARVFCSSMGDTFEDHPTNETQRQRLWPLIERTPNLQWLLLTKRPENVVAMVPKRWHSAWPKNVLPGFTAENQECYDLRHRAATNSFLNTSWFVSYEPALGPVDFGSMFGICWLIVGGESGSKARPMRREWVESARDQAVKHGVPFFFKQEKVGKEIVSLPILNGRRWTERP